MTSDFGLGPEVEEFHAEVDAFFREAMTPDRIAGHLDPTDLTGLDLEFERELQRECGRRGWLGISAPRELGGGGRPLAYQAMFGYASAYHDTPTIDTAITLAGAPLIAHASEQQRRTLIAPMLAGEINISIAYTEADAGSDLGRVATTATRVDGGWRLDGAKTLVTGAHKSEYALIIARSEPDGPPKHTMTMFVVDLAGPGVEVSRRPLMNGWTLGDIVLDDARVGDDAVLGVVGEGWRQMASALLAERSGIFYVGFAQRRLDDLTEHLDGRPGTTDTLADLAIDVGVARRFAQRVLLEQQSGAVNPHHPAASKIASTEVLQRLATEGTRMLGLEGLVWGSLLDTAVEAPLHGRFAWEYLDRVRETISVGNNELQRTSIARAEIASTSDTATDRPEITLDPSVTRQVDIARRWGTTACVEPHLTSTLLPALVTGTVAADPIGWAEVDENGLCPYVPAGQHCRRFLAVRGRRAWLVEQALETRPIAGIGDDGAARVSLDLAAAAEIVDASKPLALAQLMLAAAMGAAADAALRAAVGWVREREQFGAPLSQLGPVQQHIANMRLAVDAVNLAVDDSALRIDEGADPVILAAEAKALADRECASVTRLAHQLFGGEGLYADHRAHRWYRFVKIAEHLCVRTQS